MNISSIIVHAKPTELASVRGQLERIPGVEIHAATDDGRLVVTIETDTDGETAGTFDRINLMDGVMSAAMVFHQFESDPQKEA
ncbi:MAG: chaperone NapD [Zoogloeaceae bacterium]|nr:chaperone NapD [Zoogloeaceae bacterium]MCK6385901.1 chaperone NapD [Rhodocyclaceae bacterium]